MNIFVQHLNDENEDVLTNVVGALAECLKIPNNRTTFRQIGGLTHLVNHLGATYESLLENVTKALAECAKDLESMHILEQLDAVRLIWSLLKNPCHRVQAYAAWALCPCIENARNSGELVRSFVGAMELVVGLLKSTDNLVLSATCAAIATIAKDKNNLAVLSDHKVIPMLADLGRFSMENIINGLFFILIYYSMNNSVELNAFYFLFLLSQKYLLMTIRFVRIWLRQSQAALHMVKIHKSLADFVALHQLWATW